MFGMSLGTILSLEPVRFTIFTLTLIGIVGLAYLVRTRNAKERIRFLATAGKWAGYASAAAILIVYGARIAEQLWGTSVSVQLAFTRFWPDIPNEISVTPGSATVEPNNSGFSTATLIVDGLSPASRLLLAGETAAEAIVLLAVALVIAQLSTSLLGEKAFTRERWRLLAAAGVAMFVAGLAWIIIDIPTQMIVASEVRYSFVDIPTDAWTCTMDGSHACGLVYWDLTMFAPTWPLVVALLMVVGAFIVRRGNELENENEGLI